MNFNLFYTNYTKDEHVRSDEPKAASVDEIVQCMNNILNEADNFIGIIDANDVMLQFMVDDDHSIIVDLPVNDKKGSFLKNASLEECIAIVNGLQETIKIDRIEGLEFKAW